MKIDRFECVLATMDHEEPPVVPQTIGFTNDMAEYKLLSCLDNDVFYTEREDKNPSRIATREGPFNFERALRRAELLDNFIVESGSGGFRVKKNVKTSSKWHTVKWESGAVWRRGATKNPWAREYLKYPVENESDLDNLELPDPDNPERYERIESNVKYTIEKGFFPCCDITGFFSGVWYFLRGPLQVVLRDMYSNRRLFKMLMKKIGEFNLKAEKNVLERGSMMITWVDDLGYNKGTFMNPKLYEELIFPWHKKAIDLAHKYGAFVNLHSHGNINAILPLLVKAGLDALNPVGPSDGMNLKTLKEEYGDRVCFQGGLSKHIGFMSVTELKNHIMDRLRVGSPGGGFILSSEGDLPYEMKPERFLVFLKMSRKYRRNISL